MRFLTNLLSLPNIQCTGKDGGGDSSIDELWGQVVYILSYGLYL